MATGPRRHIVPVQMIRRFSNASGRLFCLNKTTLCVADRSVGNRPEDILHKRNYYKDEYGDLDCSWIQSVENEFGARYDSLMAAVDDGRDWTSDEQEALVRWIACLQTRTELVQESVDAMSEAGRIPDRRDIGASGAAIDNRLRLNLAQEYERVFTSPGWYWQMVSMPEHGTLILTDHPACHTPEQEPDGMVVLVPLSRTHLLVGGGKAALGQVRFWRLQLINFFLAAWANRLIYAANLSTLDRLAAQLRAAGEPATLPFYGKIRAMRTSPPPAGLPQGSVFDNIRRRAGERDKSIADPTQ